MRYSALFVLVFLLTLGACQVTPETAARIEGVLNRVTTTLDRNADGIITNPEVRDATDPNNPMTWVGLIGTVLGGLGLARTVSQKKELDEVWERTHKPVA